MDRLFTPRFLLMFGFSFTVFLSVFQLLPTAPYRILSLGGSSAAAGLFLGLLTFSSALSAPITGPISDRIGHRPMLIGVSLVLTVLVSAYAFITNYTIMLVLVVFHGLIWSGLLSASGAYMTATIPPGRRAEGLGYWGLASVVSIGAAPVIGFWVYQHGWTTLCLELAALNLLMAGIAWTLPDDRAEAAPARLDRAAARARARRDPVQLLRDHVEWRVVLLSITTALIAFGYGGLTSFSSLFADDIGVEPRSLFLMGMAIASMIARLTIGRTLDRRGHRDVLLPCLVLPAAGLAILALAQGPVSFFVAALVFGGGFGLMHPAYTAYMIGHVPARRRGAAFGGMLAAFDAGIGLGSSFVGWVVHGYGYRVAYAGAALVAGLALPYFLLVEKKLGFGATDDA